MLYEVITSLSAVYVGLSAGSMILTPRIGASFVNWQEQGGDDRTLGIVDFSIFPHLNNKDLPDNTLETAKLWINEVQRPAYVIDDDTAIVVTDDTIEVVSEGEWVKLDVSRITSYNVCYTKLLRSINSCSSLGE